MKKMIARGLCIIVVAVSVRSIISWQYSLPASSVAGYSSPERTHPMPRIESCEKDCPGRHGGCHATCDRYKKAKAKYDAQMAKYNAGRSLTTYVIDEIRKSKATHGR